MISRHKPFTQAPLGVTDSPNDVYGRVRDHLPKVPKSRNVPQKNRHAAFLLMRQHARRQADAGDAPQTGIPI